jgi:hypothetical protein
MAASANGSAKIVCEKRTKLPHFCKEDRGRRIEDGMWGKARMVD